MADGTLAAPGDGADGEKSERGREREREKKKRARVARRQLSGARVGKVKEEKVEQPLFTLISSRRKRRRRR